MAAVSESFLPGMQNSSTLVEVIYDNFLNFYRCNCKDTVIDYSTRQFCLTLVPIGRNRLFKQCGALCSRPKRWIRSLQQPTGQKKTGQMSKSKTWLPRTTTLIHTLISASTRKCWKMKFGRWLTKTLCGTTNTYLRFVCRCHIIGVIFFLQI